MIFIQLNRDIPAGLFSLRRLHRRLSVNHPQFTDINQDLYNSNAGHAGEAYIDSVLSTIHFPIPHILLPNIRIHEKDIPSTQIDILIFTTAYALIIEVKNWSGTISFQQVGQVLQTKDGIVRSMDCPTVQADYYVGNLLDWFVKHDTQLPVHRIVSFPFASTLLIGAENRGIHSAKELPIILRKLNKLPQQLTHYQFQTLSRKLQEANLPFEHATACQKYGIHPSDLLKGIFCPKCESRLLKKSNRVYVCSSCLHIPDNPFYDTMIDWFTLVGNQITNRQLRLFAGVDKSYTVGYFMKKSNFPYSGQNKGTIYHVNAEEMHRFLSKKEKACFRK
ncbi:NERD domain-containing protein [Paenisporosarcina sp. FSL H8-0542]|uniref:NERD domain-containing protein n=1 Tax=Paenisporosarcina sp. FSL H8-0542 TaxID=2921401 RepID=UPI00315A14B1